MRIFKPFSKLKNSVQTRFSPVFKKHGRKIGGIVIAAFIIVMLVSAFTKKPATVAEQRTPKPLGVEVMVLDGQTPSLNTTASIRNLGVVTLVAQTAGPVKNIQVTEGKYVKTGTQIVSQETGYGTGNAAAIGAQIAQKNLEIADKSYTNTQEMVRLSRETADKNRDNTEELRKISQQSIDGTRKLLDTTRLVIQKIESDLAVTTDPDQIQGLRQQLINYQNILNGTETQLRNVEFSTNTDKAPTKLADLAKDQVYKSTELQLETSRISKEISELSLRSARITASLATVRAPFAGTIERVFVTKGQYVSPGTPVAKLSGNPQLCLIITVSGQTAQRIQMPGTITLTVGGAEYTVPITHVSSTPTAGSLYEVLAVLPENLTKQVYEGQSVDVKVQTAQTKTIQFNGRSYLVPLEAVFVTNLERYVFIAKDGKAVRAVVQTGEILGNDIEILTGLNSGDHLILDRRVIDGQAIEEQINQQKVEERG